MGKKSFENVKKLDKPSLKETNIIVRIVYALVFFGLGFNFSRVLFYKDFPFFGYHTFLEVLAGLIAAAFGFFVFAIILMKIKYWLESVMSSVISRIVDDFWDQQSKRIQQARRDKQRLKADEKSIREKQELESAIILDTSVLIDGRVLDVVKAGFLDRTFVVAQNVLNELQNLSDSKNKVKRTRGRMGLDVVKELKKRTSVVVPEIKTKEKEVDTILVNYAKEKKLRLMTLDFNLNKVAKVSGISVLNLNDLVNALKTVLLPGERFKVKIAQAGKEKKQGIGYLNDGTMVVIENGIEKVGEEVEAVVIKVIQSSAGKIIFSEVAKNGNSTGGDSAVEDKK